MSNFFNPEASGSPEKPNSSIENRKAKGNSELSAYTDKEKSLLKNYESKIENAIAESSGLFRDLKDEFNKHNTEIDDVNKSLAEKFKNEKSIEKLTRQIEYNSEAQKQAQKALEIQTENQKGISTEKDETGSGQGGTSTSNIALANVKQSIKNLTSAVERDLKPAKSATEAEKKSLQARVEVFKKYQQELESILTSYTTEFFTNLKGSTSYEKKEIERLKEKGGELASEKQKLESKVKNNDSDEKASKLEKRKKELNNTADELIQNRQEELAKLDKELDGKLSALKASYKTTVEKLNNEYEKAEPQNLNQNVQNLSPRKIELPTTPVENLKKKEGQVQTNNRSI